MSNKPKDTFWNNADKRMAGVLDQAIGMEVAILFRADMIVAPDGTGAVVKGILHASEGDPEGQYALITDQGKDKGVVTYSFDVSRVAAMLTPTPRPAYEQFLAEAKAKEQEAVEQLEAMLKERVAQIEIGKQKIIH